MARSQQTVNTTVRGMLTVYDTSNNAVTGLVEANFTILSSKDGVDNSATLDVAIAEVGNGRYTYTFTPDVIGYWHLLFRHATYNPRGWQDEFDVLNST
jgi:hypothetical protein